MFYTNDECDSHNQKRIEDLKEAGQESIVLKAKDEFVDHRNTKEKNLQNLLPQRVDSTGGLPKEIKLVQGL